ncbi:MAG: bifunctional phosphoglucose/phosphomannose isomerase [Candidatus Eisenbacteria bacterium]
MSEWGSLRERHDRSGMYERIRDLPEQIGEAASRFRVLSPDPDGGGVRNILLLGMGGSAIGGEIASALLAPESGLPVFVSRGYDAPAWCGGDTFAVATSYSGNTEETLAAAESALSRGARLAAVSSGGSLGALAEARGLPLVLVPGGCPPRAAIGHLTVSALLLLEKAGLSPSWAGALGEAVRLLEDLRAEWNIGAAPGEGAPSRVARALHGSFPVLYHGGGEMAPVAARWCGQLAENSKTLSHRAAFPEANHNEIVGWERAPALPPIAVVALESGGDRPTVRKGMECALRLVEGSARSVLRLEARGDRPVARILGGVYFGDFVSYFLALLNGVDPTPVRSIDQLKRELAHGNTAARYAGEDGREAR